MPGIGKVSERILESLGIVVRPHISCAYGQIDLLLRAFVHPAVQTCGDIITHRAILHLLDFGVTDLLRSALGCCSNKVEPGKRSDRKSVGVES